MLSRKLGRWLRTTGKSDKTRRYSRLFLEPLEPRLTPDASPGIQPGSLLAVFPNSTPFGSAQPNDVSAQVTGLYQLLLNRAPDNSGLAFWSNQVKAGVKLGQVATFFQGSLEYSKSLVSADYQYILGRTPDAAGLTFWTNWVEAHADARGLAVQLLASGEYQNAHADTNNLVQSIYSKVLGRTGDAGGTTFWVQQVANGLSPLALVTGFAYSTEALETGLEGFYQSFLQTTADSSVLTGSLPQYENQPIQSVLAKVVDMPQYQNAATGGLGGAPFSNDFAFNSSTLSADSTEEVAAGAAAPYGQALNFPSVPYDATQTGTAVQPTLLIGSSLLSQAALQGGLTFQIQFKASNPGALLTEQLAVTGDGSTTNYLAPLVYLNGSGRLAAGVFDQTSLTIQLPQNLLSWPDARGLIQIGAANPLVSMGTLVDNVWHEATLVATTTSESLYVDGVLQGTTTGSYSMTPVTTNLGTNVTPGMAYIGGTIVPEPAVAPYPKMNYPQGYEGAVDEVGLWTDTVNTHGESAFTQAQVQQTLSGPLSTSSPVTTSNRWAAYFNFDQTVAGTTNQWPNLATGATGIATGPSTGTVLTTKASTIAFDPFPDTVPRLPGYLNMGIRPMTPLAESTVVLNAGAATKFKVSLEAGDQLKISLPQVPPGSLSVSIEDNLGNSLPSFQINSDGQQVIAVDQTLVFQLTLTWTPTQQGNQGQVIFDNFPGPNNSIMELLTSFKQTGPQAQGNTIYAYSDPALPMINSTVNTNNPTAAANYFPLWTDTKYFPTTSAYTAADLSAAYVALVKKIPAGLTSFGNIIGTTVSDPTAIQRDLDLAYQNAYGVAPPQPPKNNIPFPVLPADTPQNAVYEFLYNTDLLRATIYPVLTGSGTSPSPSSLPTWIQGAINEINSSNTALSIANTIALGQAQQVPSSITIKQPAVQRSTDWISVIANITTSIGGALQLVNPAVSLGFRVLGGSLLVGGALMNTFASQGEAQNLTVDVSSITNAIVNAVNLQQMALTIDNSESQQWGNFRNALLNSKFVQSVLSNYGLMQALDTISSAPLGDPAMSPTKAIDDQVSYIAWQNMIPAVFHWEALTDALGDQNPPVLVPPLLRDGTAGTAIIPNNVASTLPNFLSNLAVLQGGGSVTREGPKPSPIFGGASLYTYQASGNVGIPFLAITQAKVTTTFGALGKLAYDGAYMQAWQLVDNSGHAIAANTANKLFGNPAAAGQTLTPINPLEPVMGYNGGWYYAAQPFQNAPTTRAQAFFSWGQGTAGYAPQSLAAAQAGKGLVTTMGLAVSDAPPAILQGTQVDLSKAYNRVGITTLSKPFSGGADGDGTALPYNLLGPGLNYGVPFTFGPPDQNNVVDAQGQTIPLPAGNFSSLYMLAIGVNGDQLNRSFTVTYTDDSTQSFTQSFSDWTNKNPQPGQFTAVLADYLLLANGTAQEKSGVSVYGVDFTGLDLTKTVKSITLPGGSNLEILAMTLAQGGRRVGAVHDGASFPSGSGLDGGGLAFSLDKLGSSIKYNQTTFQLNAADPNNAISAMGQLVPLNSSGATVLNILAVGINGNQPNQTFTLNYPDARPQLLTQSFSDWTTPQNYFGEAVVSIASTVNKFDGTTVPGLHYLYAYSIPISSNLESITLPNNPNLEILGLQVAAAPVTARMGIAKDGTTFPNNTGLDGAGLALLTSQLGSSVTSNGSTFTFGPSNAPDVFSAVGQTLAVTPGKYARLNLLALATFGQAKDQVFTVTYTDGTTSTFTQSLNDWFSFNPSLFPGESVAKRMDAYAQSSGQPGFRGAGVFVYGYTFAIDINKTILSLTLPNDPNVEILGLQPN